MNITISLLLFGMVMIGISLAGYHRFSKPVRSFRRMIQPGAGVAGAPRAATSAADAGPGSLIKVLLKAGALMPVSPTILADTKHDLISAGYRAENGVVVYAGLRLVSVALLLFCMFLFRNAVDSPTARIMLLAVAGGVGWMLPGFVLQRMIKSRRNRLRLTLPDALDLLVISVESGLGLDQAIHYVSRELRATHKDVSEELALMTLEMRAGKRRSDALKNLAARTGEPTIEQLVAILVQNDRFGTSMAESLRQHSDAMRVTRRQEAEERAAKVGAKLVFPIFFLIMPSMMLAAVGPALLQVFKHLFPMMKNVK